MARPSSASNASRLATSTTLIPDAAICRANSLPIPDEAPVTSAHGPNCPLSRAAFFMVSILNLLLQNSVSQSGDPILKPLPCRYHDSRSLSATPDRCHTLKG